MLAFIGTSDVLCLTGQRCTAGPVCMQIQCTYRLSMTARLAPWTLLALSGFETAAQTDTLNVWFVEAREGCGLSS